MTLVPPPRLLESFWAMWMYFFSSFGFLLIGLLGLWSTRRSDPDPRAPRLFYWILTVLGAATLILVTLAATLG